MKMETAYRLVGLSGAVFGVFETKTEAENVSRLYGTTSVEEYRIPYCMFTDMFNLAE